MKIAYLILVHKSHNQLKRLIDRLNSNNVQFYIHLDVKSDISPFKKLLSNQNNVHFVKKREDGRWGDLGIVKGTLNGLKEIQESNIDFSHVVLLSGQDYPIKSNEEIAEFFTNNLGVDFISYTPFPVKNLNWGGRDRIESYAYNFLGRRVSYLPFKYCQNLNAKGYLINFVLMMLKLVSKQRKLPNNLAPYYGSQWWNLSLETVQNILTFVESTPEYLNFHKYSLLPDEMFFQTIIMNLSNSVNSQNNNLRYIDWENGGSHPKSLNLSDFDFLQQSDALFARKFETETQILDTIDLNFLKWKG